MNRKQLILLIILTLLHSSYLFAEDARPPLAFSITTDATYFPESNHISGKHNHFAPFTGPFGGTEFRSTVNASYTINTPFGSSPLFSGNTLVFTGNFELSPVTILQKAKVTFTPVAFFVVSGGAMAGTGWTIFDSVQGIGEYNPKTKSYDDLTPFKSWYTNIWASGTLQFDVAAIWPGAWHHIVMQAAYEVDYINLTNTSSNLWNWQVTYCCTNGLQFYESYILAYQMPSTVSLVGLYWELWGHYDTSDYGEYSETYKGDFISTNLSSVMQLTFSKKDSMYIIITFQGQRGFEEEYISSAEEINLTMSCREWYFRRLGISWTHSF